MADPFIYGEPLKNSLVLEYRICLRGHCKYYSVARSDSSHNLALCQCSHMHSLLG